MRRHWRHHPRSGPIEAPAQRRRPRLEFRFLRDAPHGGQSTLHLLHDGYPVGKAQQESEQLPLILTALANLRVQPQALAQFLLAVPDEVLRRCGVILAQMATDAQR